MVAQFLPEIGTNNPICKCACLIGGSTEQLAQFRVPAEIVKELSPEQLETMERAIRLHHAHRRRQQTDSPSQQCSNLLVQRINAPARLAWNILRRFDSPQTYKRFVKACVMTRGTGGVGSTREVTVVSGLPASCSTERLELLDDETRVLGFRVLGGEHRLRNYCSITSVHELGRAAAMVLESYVVDVPEGNTSEDTCLFTDTVVKCNLQSLARVCQQEFHKEQAKELKSTVLRAGNQEHKQQ